MNRQREQARAAGKFKAGASAHFDGPPTRFVGYDALAGRRHGAGALSRRRAGGAGRGRPGRGRGARHHAVLCRIGRPGGRPRRAARGAAHVRRAGHAEAAAGGVRPPRQRTRPAACAWASACTPPSTRTRASARATTTRPPTCCTPRCAPCSAATCSRRARSSMPSRTRFDFSHDKPLTRRRDPPRRGAVSMRRSAPTPR